MDNVFKKIVDINEYVFTTIPWTIVPYTGNKHKIDMSDPELIPVLDGMFKSKEIGGWCGLNCEVFQRMVLGLGLIAEPFNYGVRDLTHITIIVFISNKWYLFDPYFNKYYMVDGEPVDFFKMIDFIRSGKSNIVDAVYGKGTKEVEQNDGSWIDFSGQDLEKSVMDAFSTMGLDDILIDRFGDTNPFNFMTMEIIKNGRPPLIRVNPYG